jgi:ATP/maltotriose-dependent transcriptional regulator MalT
MCQNWAVTPLGGLFGRDKELARLNDALYEAVRGRSSTVLIRGVAGIGKSRLVSEFGVTADARMLRGHCPPQVMASLMYAPIVQAIRPLADSAEVAALPATQVSALAPVFPLFDQPPDAQARWAQTRLFEVLYTLLRQLSQRAPIVLVLEDLHWADQGTMDFLHYLAANASNDRLLVVCTVRVDEPGIPSWLSRSVARLAAEAHTMPLNLEPLDEQSARELLAASGHVATEMLRTSDVLRRAEGNPLYLEQLGVASTHDAAEIPTQLYDLLAWRVASLSPPARGVLEVVSVAGGTASADLVEQVTPSTADVLDNAIDEALASHLLVRSGSDCYKLHHALLGEMVYRDLGSGRRARMHRAIAVALAERLAADVDIASAGASIARHWRLGGRPDEAFAPLLAAAEAARARGLQHDAARMFDELIDMWHVLVPTAYSPPVRFSELLTSYADSMRWAADPTDVVNAYERALAAVKLDGQPRQRGTVYERYARALFDAGRPDDALQAARTACTLLDGEPDAMTARASATVGALLMARGAYAESKGYCERALKIAETYDAAKEGAHAMRLLGVDQANLGELSQAVESLRCSLRMCIEHNLVEDQIHTHVNLSYVLHKAGRWTESVESARAGRRLAALSGLDASLGALPVGNEVGGLMALGRWDEAIEAARITIAPGAASESREYLDLVLCEIEIARGDFPAVEARLAQHAKESRSGVVTTGERHLVIAQLAYARGDHTAAYSAAVEALRDADNVEPETTLQLCAYGLAALVELDSPTGRHLLESSQLPLVPDELTGRAEVCAATVPDLEPCQILLELCRAEARRFVGRSTSTEWRRVAQRFGGLSQPYPQSMCLYRAAVVALGEADTSPAAVLLNEAGAIAHRLGANVLLAGIAALRERVGVPPAENILRPSVSTLPDQRARQFRLTDRERQVVACLAAGSSNRQIARELAISEKTASVHVSNILAKLHVRSRAEATAAIHMYSLTGGS